MRRRDFRAVYRRPSPRTTRVKTERTLMWRFRLSCARMMIVMATVWMTQWRKRAGGVDARPATVLEHAIRQASMPEWGKISAGWWAEGALDDGAFLQSIQYLIDYGIIQIPATESGGNEGAGRYRRGCGPAPGGGPRAPSMTTRSCGPYSSSYRAGS